jgi:DNA-binding response OmpR family regulator
MESATQLSSTRGNILIVDDERATRHTLADLLRREGYRVVEAASGPEALKLLASQGFDLVMLDLKMPEMDGTEVLQAARPLAPDTAFIILTAYGTLDSAMIAIRNGASDYLLKPSSPQEIIRAVEVGLAQRQRVVAREEAVTFLEQALAGLKTTVQTPTTASTSDRFLHILDVTVDTLRQLVVVRGHPAELTPTEFDILVYLLRHRGQVISCRELVAHLHGYELDEVDARIVIRTHMHRLRHKLERGPSETQIISIVRGRGYRIKDETDYSLTLK